ncbi:putative transcription elongation factor SPT5 protein [Trifolium repens]|nr:putative transcription elongation factor SPT5 protein [Trifolium repens]
MTSRRGKHNVEEEEEEEEEYERKRRRFQNSARFFDEDVEVVSDEEEEEVSEEGYDDFIDESPGIDDLPEEDGGKHQGPLRMPPPYQQDYEDLEAIERSIQERYRNISVDYHEEETTKIVQQSLLPSVRDPKMWLVKCAIGRERETAVCLIRKYMHTGSELQIKSAIALDHLKNYIYVEAYKEAHVREACKGLSNILNQKIMLVPIKEMADVLSVESKVLDLARDTWVKMKVGIYKGDLAKVVDVDNVRQRVTVKLIPRIDLQALANKLEGRQGVIKKAFVPPPRFMRVDEARKLHIRVEHKRDAYGEHFIAIGGKMFKDGFYYKTVAIKSINAQNIKPTFDELEKFHKPGKSGDGFFAGRKKHNFINELGKFHKPGESGDGFFVSRKEHNFIKGDVIIITKGDLKNLKGWVEKVDGDNVLIRPKEQGLTETIAVNIMQLCKYFELGNHVKVVSGAQEGATGMVVDAEENVLTLITDVTKEEIRVFADDAVESSEVASGVSNGRGGSGSRDALSGVKSGNSENQKAANGRGGRRRLDSLCGATVKVRQGPYKGHRGRVIGVQGTSVRLELESQMMPIIVDRNYISDNVAVTPYRDASRYGMGSETPMHPSQTPLHPIMTPMRDRGATPIHDGMTNLCFTEH